MSVKAVTIPTKILSQSITASATSFRLNDIKGWDNVDLTSAAFGTQAYGVFRNAARTQIELFEFDPTTIASSDITIVLRGLKYDGTLATEVSGNKYAWTKGDTYVDIGTDVPQIFQNLLDNVAATETNVGAILYNAASKTTPVDADSFPITDSAASNVLKKLTFANLKTWLTTAFTTIELGHATDTTISRVSSGKIAVEGNEVVQANSTGTRTLILTAAGGKPTTTSGCAASTTVEAGTNDVDYTVLDFDATAQEFAFWNVQMPDNYDGSTVTARFIWTAAAGGAGSTVVWGIAGRAFGNDDAIDQAFGTAVEVSDDWIANGDVHVTSATSAITLGGTPAGGEFVVFRVYRDPADANDDLTGDARLMAVQIEYGINAYSD